MAPDVDLDRHFTGSDPVSGNDPIRDDEWLQAIVLLLTEHLKSRRLFQCKIVGRPAAARDCIPHRRPEAMFDYVPRMKRSPGDAGTEIIECFEERPTELVPRGGDEIDDPTDRWLVSQQSRLVEELRQHALIATIGKGELFRVSDARMSARIGKPERSVVVAA